MAGWSLPLSLPPVCFSRPLFLLPSFLGFFLLPPLVSPYPPLFIFILDFVYWHLTVCFLFLSFFRSLFLLSSFLSTLNSIYSFCFVYLSFLSIFFSLPPLTSSLYPPSSNTWLFSFCVLDKERKKKTYYLFPHSYISFFPHNMFNVVHVPPDFDGRLSLSSGRRKFAILS